jgi:hypothetical protein
MAGRPSQRHQPRAAGHRLGQRLPEGRADGEAGGRVATGGAARGGQRAAGTGVPSVLRLACAWDSARGALRCAARAHTHAL